MNLDKRVLVIDDEEAVRKSFQLALEDMGLQVDLAESGEVGLKMHGGHKYDLIFLDLKMPGLNGVETLQEIHRMNADITVYIVTAFHEEFFDDLQILIDRGIEFDVVHKPIGAEQIELVVESVLHGLSASPTN